MNAGFVKIRRGVIDHVRDGKLSVSEFAVFQLLVLLADSSTGAQTVNAAVLRSCYFQDMTRDTAQRTLASLEAKGFIFRQNPASSRRAYRYVVNKYEATTGQNRLRRTDLSQVFVTKDINDVRWVECATEIPTGMSAGIPTGIPNSNKKEEIEKEELSSSPGREDGPSALEHSATHVEFSASKVALPEEAFSLTSSSSSISPGSPAATPRSAKTTKNTKAVDPRTAEFRVALEHDWAENNPEVSLPWDGGDATALKKLLSGGKFKLELFKSCLINRSRSDNANTGDRPRKFLPNITSYSRGALDAYGRLKSQTGPVNTSSVGRPDIVRESAEHLEKKRRALEEEQAQIMSGRQVAHA